MSGMNEAFSQAVSLVPDAPVSTVPPVGAVLAQLEGIALAIRQQASEPPGGVGPAETRLLQCLAEHGNRTVPELARLRGTSRQNIQIIANRLAREGCVEFNGNPAHKRSALVRLTDPGRERLKRAEEHESALAAKLRSALPAAELMKASDLLQRIHEVLSATTDVGAAEDPSRERTHANPRRKQLAAKHHQAPQANTSPGLSDQLTDYGLPANLL